MLTVLSEGVRGGVREEARGGPHRCMTGPLYDCTHCPSLHAPFVRRCCCVTCGDEAIGC